jgi:2-polyprenyl-6-methoxyphenol hydroxylase-like FAD-dependent oxidoreductase
VREPEVLIVGAGPVGLTLAIDLGQRGVRVVLIEKNDRNGLLPKMERCNARTMEIFHRLGIADEVRDAGFPRDCAMDVFIITAMNEPPILRLPYPSVNELKAETAAHNDGRRSLEPYQLISQYTLEPLLTEIARRLPTVEILFGHELVSFEQDAAGVTAQVLTSDGEEVTIASAYLVGCDGGGSTVRKALGIRYEGEGGLRRMRHALFRSDDLYEKIPIGQGRHYHVADDEFTMVTVQDSRRHFRMTTLWKEGEEDLEAKFRRVVGFPIEAEVIYTGEWTQNLLCATSYGSSRVLIAGDAAHLVIPTGGLGMNTGVGDAIDLGWKLAGSLAGWGGPSLLDSYEDERRQIGLRNVRASGAAMEGRLGWRSAWTPDIRDQTAAGEAARARIARIADIEQRKTNEILGIEMGYRYTASPIVWPEAGEGPDPDNRHYEPTTWPGARLPHVWLENGEALHDRLGPGFTLLRLGPDVPDTRALEDAMRATGAPFEVWSLDEPAANAVYGRRLILVRPDLHVVWRGDVLSADSQAIAAVAVGRIDARALQTAA